MVGLISALLAFGNVKAIHSSIEKVLRETGPHPWKFIASLRDDEIPDLFEGVFHRWVRRGDFCLLFKVLKRVREKHRSLKDLFLEGYDERDSDLAPAIDHFSRKCLSFAGLGQLPRGFRYFFPTPQDGSPCKRLNMFLRWMVRPADGIDLGLWKEIPPSKLIIPLDTHVYRFARRFRLSRFKSQSLKMANDISMFLRTIDPDDPVRFDFAICHYGMEKGW